MIGRSAFRRNSCRRRCSKDNLASLQGPALAGWKLEPILPALGDRAAALVERFRQAAGAVLHLSPAHRSAHAAGR